MTTEAWEDRYQDVVWARFGTFPFWPSYIFDPKLVSKKEPEYDRAQKMIGSKYFVLFYADNTLGFISPKDIRPFDEETTATFAKQKMNRKDALKLPLAIEEARKEILLTKDRRLRWYFDKYNISMDGSKPEEDDDPDQISGLDEQESQEVMWYWSKDYFINSRHTYRKASCITKRAIKSVRGKMKATRRRPSLRMIPT